MNLKIREAALADYDNINNLVIEVHNLHVKNRPDVYLDIQNPFLKEHILKLKILNYLIVIMKIFQIKSLKLIMMKLNK